MKTNVLSSAEVNWEESRSYYCLEELQLHFSPLDEQMRKKCFFFTLFAIQVFYFKCARHPTAEGDRCVALRLIRSNTRDIPCLACADVKWVHGNQFATSTHVFCRNFSHLYLLTFIVINTFFAPRGTLQPLERFLYRGRFLSYCRLRWLVRLSASIQPRDI